MHVAAERGCFNIVEYLVDREVDINIQDNNGVSDCECRQSGTTDLVSYIFMYNAEQLSILGLKMIRTHHHATLHSQPNLKHMH